MVGLGDALLRIQAPNQAAQAFAQALDRDPSDALLAAKIGRTLVATHDYRRAQAYYEAALTSAHLTARQSLDMRHDLGKLLIKLRKYVGQGKPAAPPPPPTRPKTPSA